jgi:hypothetical protein
VKEKVCVLIIAFFLQTTHVPVLRLFPFCAPIPRHVAHLDRHAFLGEAPSNAKRVVGPSLPPIHHLLDHPLEAAAAMIMQAKANRTPFPLPEAL